MVLIFTFSSNHYSAAVDSRAGRMRSEKALQYRHHTSFHPRSADKLKVSASISQCPAAPCQACKCHHCSHCNIPAPHGSVGFYSTLVATPKSIFETRVGHGPSHPVRRVGGNQNQAGLPRGIRSIPNRRVYGGIRREVVVHRNSGDLTPIVWICETSTYCPSPNAESGCTPKNATNGLVNWTRHSRRDAEGCRAGARRGQRAGCWRC